MKQDTLRKSLESTVKKLLVAAKDEPFENKLDALKVAIVWYNASRKIGVGDDDAGKLLEEMRKAIDEPAVQTSERGASGDGASAGSAGATSVTPSPFTYLLNAEDA